MQNNIVPVSIAKELENSYLSYAMSVIISRAIPDVRDGFKPVHRRILYAMSRAGYDSGKPYKKAARIVGDVMGKYHPHGDMAIYDSLVRMAQDFSLLLPLIDGQGNFGSVDGDPPASMRYTEVRLHKISHFLLNDIDEDIVDFRLNYDGSETEPVVLPAEFPNLLVNGASGVAVGMATNIPSHNLGEVIDACMLYIDNPKITLDDLLEVIPGPDFPTGGTILGKSGIRSAFATGRGSIAVQGKTHIEDLQQDRQAIVIDEIPYQVNKVKLIEKIDELVKEKKIDGIIGIRDESDKTGIRVVIDLKKNTIVDFVLNQVFGLTPLRSSFSVNTLVLNNNRPTLMSLKEIIAAFIDFRKEALTRRTEFRLRKIREKAHIHIGLYIASLNIDEVIKIIRSTKNPEEASEELSNKEWKTSAEVSSIIEIISDSIRFLKNGVYRLTLLQVKAILDMKLQRLTGLERNKLKTELNSMVNLMKEYVAFLGSEEKLMKEIKDNLQEIKNRFAVSRKTSIEESGSDIEAEDLIPQEDMVVTVTMNGYIKRVKLSHYKTQRRGGKGKVGQGLKEEDVTTKLFVGNTHTSLLFFSNIGRVYRLKVYKLPLAEPTARGRALVNIFPLTNSETITNIMPLPGESDENQNIVFATAHGNIRRNSLADFHYIPSNGKIAIKLDEGDKLISVKVCNETDHVLLSTMFGKGIRFVISDVRQFKGRNSDGVRGIKLAKHDSVISMTILNGIEIATETKELYLKVPLTKRLEAAISNSISSKLEKTLKDLEIGNELFLKLATNEEFILTITENGFGKRTSAYEYRVTNRGGFGITDILTTNRNGNVIASFPVEHDDNIMLITDKGKLIRISVNEIRVAGRSTKGVTLFKTENKEKVVSVAKIEDHSSTENSISEIEGSIFS
ncbi:DNA gyrase subunit A [Wolbachia endosymbiont of Cruorifilaria tuberocauda]|uniref:DNA gyrase subunit A n=1 Tax=Wolbachia endosymbiont of Cruorifilaria tuberocauda TaxID=1812111 RepID=UPI00158E5DDE|nr:DNA gyrase subunit A [Wolbachia endosymbiont of Cruorifilaria tuberocauda]QKX01524.1 DNA gyrase subunit A [Wolbachia endosymbiont of Cruorifilaria tuberocauda]